MFQVVTFNVLHLTHEINHTLGKSPILDEYKIGTFGDLTKKISMSDTREKEQNRIKDLFTIIRSMCSPRTIVCLQEVPGDLLHLLVDQLVDFKVFSHTYDRVPSVKKTHRIVLDCKNIYNDPQESLVTIVPISQGWNTITSVPCDTDPGKACLIVTFDVIRESSIDPCIDRITIANAHIPFQSMERREFLQKLIPHLNPLKMFILTGDTNVDCKDFENDLQNIHLDWALSVPIKATRRGTRSSLLLEESCIDYFIHRGIFVSNVFSHPFSNVSDHTLVQCDFVIL